MLKSFPRPLSLSLVLLGTVFSFLPASAQVVGHIGFRGAVVDLRLSPTGLGIEALQTRELFASENIVALERADDGTLLAITVDPADTRRLYSVDLDTESAEELRTLSLSGSHDLAFDELGLLWISADEGLFTYDVGTDTLTAAGSLPAGNFVAITWWQGELYTITGFVIGIEGPTLNVVDPATGTVVRGRDLPSFGGAQFYSFPALSFDDGGGLWIGTRADNGLIFPPSEAYVTYLDDPWTGNPESRFVPNGTQFPSAPLAVAGSLPVTDVPGLRGVGAVALGLLLALAACLQLRRR